MIKWVDVVSPTLRGLHQEWIKLRGAQIMPIVTEYNAFAGLDSAKASSSLATFLMIPADGTGPVFRHIGPDVPEPLGRHASGTRLASMTGMADRAMTLPFQRVCTSRQPQSHRALAGTGGRAKEYEMLLLPFGDGKHRVCLIHAVFDLGINDVSKAFAA